MMKYLTIFLFVACSNYSNLTENLVKKGVFNIKGGIGQENTWHKDLPFKRLSWFHELTLYYDLMYVRVQKDSPFRKWFSKDELGYLNTCNDFVITLNYSHDSKKISVPEVVSQIEEQGYKSIAIPYFEKNLRLHPDFEKESLQLYKVYGNCLEGSKDGNISINFPGFLTQEII